MRLLLFVAGLRLVQTSAPIGESFSLKLGETTRVDDTDLSLKFVAVTQDSRCPRDVQCIVAGEAVVVFEARVRERVSELVFRVPPGGGDAVKLNGLDGLEIAVVVVEPATDSKRTIEQADYVVKVKITQAEDE